MIKEKKANTVLAILCTALSDQNEICRQIIFVVSTANKQKKLLHKMVQFLLD